jgi:tetratricopeptide (TPR) repeat protein
MLALRASVHLWSGRTLAALRRAEESLEAFREIGDLFGQSQAVAVHARALMLSGDAAGGAREFDEALRLFVDTAGTADMAALVSTAAAAAAVDAGDAESALGYLGREVAPDRDIARIGQADRQCAFGLALAQLGQFDRAAAELEPLTDENGPDPNAQAVLAMVRVATGDLAGAAHLAELVGASTRATYVDRLRAGLASAFVHARHERRIEASADLRRVADLVAATDDQVHRVVVALAAAAIDPADPPVAARRAGPAGLAMSGWVALFEAMAQ